MDPSVRADRGAWHGEGERRAGGDLEVVDEEEGEVAEAQCGDVEGEVRVDDAAAEEVEERGAERGEDGEERRGRDEE